MPCCRRALHGTPISATAALLHVLVAYSTCSSVANACACATTSLGDELVIASGQLGLGFHYTAHYPVQFYDDVVHKSDFVLGYFPQKNL